MIYVLTSKLHRTMKQLLLLNDDGNGGEVEAAAMGDSLPAISWVILQDNASKDRVDYFFLNNSRNE